MNDRARRAWFQLHLSTLLLLAFMAGGLLWLNLRERISNIDHLDDSQLMVAYAHPPDPSVMYPSSRRENISERGWPMTFASRQSYLSLHFEIKLNYDEPDTLRQQIRDEIKEKVEHGNYREGGKYWSDPEPSDTWSWSALAQNLVLGIVILIPIAALLELIARRNVVKTPDG